MDSFASRISPGSPQSFHGPSCKGISGVNHAYQAAKKLGAKKLILHSGFIPSVYFLTGWAERMADFYKKFLEDKDDSVEILMENVMDPLPEPLREIMENVSHPSFGICLDIGHANCFSRTDCKEWAEMLFPYIRHLHLHDNPGDRKSVV